ncbi:MAG: HAD family hydrolase [Planctomycetota bacterium]
MACPSPKKTVRIAMWSGPRNLSTTLMRSWGARPDTFVTDEPLYAHYLQETTDRRHPGYTETLAAHDADWQRVTHWLTGSVPDGRAVWYQKQMAHHLLPCVGRGWVDRLTNAFLIRHPASVLVSMTEFFPDPRPEDIGLPQQVELFRREWDRTGVVPAVVDSCDVLRDPPGVLAALCDRLGVAYTDQMLTWSPGLRETDGAWAPFWYKKVEPTTGFGPPRETTTDVPRQLEPVLEQCLPLYEELHQYRLLAT